MSGAELVAEIRRAFGVERVWVVASRGRFASFVDRKLAADAAMRRRGRVSGDLGATWYRHDGARWVLAEDPRASADGGDR